MYTGWNGVCHVVTHRNIHKRYVLISGEHFSVSPLILFIINVLSALGRQIHNYSDNLVNTVEPFKIFPSGVGHVSAKCPETTLVNDVSAGYVDGQHFQHIHIIYVICQSCIFFFLYCPRLQNKMQLSEQFCST